MTRNEIVRLFERRGVLATAQRVEIAGIVFEKPQHLSADQIIDRLREQGSAVSKATVYNTLNLFGKRGIVREVMVDPVRKFYDSTTTDHHHFYNVDSGELHDIPSDALQISNIPELPEGTLEDGVDVVIRVKNC